MSYALGLKSPPIKLENNNAPSTYRRVNEIDTYTKYCLDARYDEVMTRFVSASVRSTILLVLENNPPENYAMTDPR